MAIKGLRKVNEILADESGYVTAKVLEVGDVRSTFKQNGKTKTKDQVEFVFLVEGSQNAVEMRAWLNPCVSSKQFPDGGYTVATQIAINFGYDLDGLDDRLDELSTLLEGLIGTTVRFKLTERNKKGFRNPDLKTLELAA